MSEREPPGLDGPVEGVGQADGRELAGASLGDEDARALEALCACGFCAESVDERMRARAERVLALLGLIESPGSGGPGDADGLIDATLARVRLHGAAAADGGVRLSANDEDALEALVGAGFDASRVRGGIRARAQRHERLLRLLDVPASEVRGAEGAEGLVARTLAGVQSAIEAQESRLNIESVRASRRFRVSDLVTVAALVLIGTAAVGPMVAAMRAQSQRLACQANLQGAGLAFGQYAADYKDSMPMASASLAGTPWWFVGKPQESNAANMYTLARTGFVGLDRLACPGNSSACVKAAKDDAMDWGCLDEVSYSYQNLFGRPTRALRVSGSTGASVVAVDASPVVRRAVRGLWINPLANSASHGERGQNALFNDGHVRWLTSPVLESGDNVWLPRFVEQAIGKASRPTRADPIKGTETPGGPDDEFVGP